jgi:hypothetical protein
MIKIDGNRVYADTTTLKAIFENGILISLVRKSDGREFIQLGEEKRIPMFLVYSGQEMSQLSGEVSDHITCLPINDYCAEIRLESWNGDGIINISEDRETGDLIVEPSGYASRPGLKACRWMLMGIDKGLELIAPFHQGIRLPLDDSMIRNSYWNWPIRWEAGLAILQGNDGGFWVHCQDDRYRYKGIKVGLQDNTQCLGFDTDAYGPLDNNLSSGGLAWRINVYNGDWQVPAGKYRDWLIKGFGLDKAIRPDWVKDIKFAISWCPTNPAILDALAKILKPEQVLLHLPNWRTDHYDENYPTFIASEAGKAFVQKAISMGFHVMPHCNSVDMDPSHPVYNYIRDFQYRSLESKRAEGWTWFDGRVKPVPESNVTRLKHRDKKTMIKVHPGLGMWRSILTENVRSAVEDLSLNEVFLDVTLCSWNLHNCIVDNTTPTEGMKRLIAQVASLKPNLVVGGEGRNEIMMQELGFIQAHLFWGSADNMQRLLDGGACPLNEFMFGQWCRSFGYSNLGGRNAEENLRMKAHVALGAIPTVTIGSPTELEQPNEAVKEMLDLAKA